MPIEGSIIDIESTHYDATQGELFTVGFLSKNGFTIFQRADSPESSFKNWVSGQMMLFPKPWFAFNKKCEEGFCGKTITNELQIGNEATYIALRNENLLDHYNLLCDPLFGEEAPDFWQAWKKTGNPLFLSKIIRHNYCCLAKEFYLKLKRVDNLKVDEIKPLLTSGFIEKSYIRPILNIRYK